MQRYKITLEYDGTNYHGWQKQLAIKTIQGEVENAIYKFCQKHVTIYASGRTDSGVHALAQIAHFDLEKNYPIQEIKGALNFYLYNKNIAIIIVEQVSNDFHARFSAISRSYEYKIFNRYVSSPLYKNRMWHVKHILDDKKMHNAAQILVGTHDFSSFRATGCQAKSPIKTINSINIGRSPENHNLIIMNITAKSFLHHQVRNFIGTLYDVGNNKIILEDLKFILNKKNRKYALQTAPAYGLYLKEVKY